MQKVQNKNLKVTSLPIKHNRCFGLVFYASRFFVNAGCEQNYVIFTCDLENKSGSLKACFN